MAKQPYLNLFTGDWLRDTALMSWELKGVWIDLLCHLHNQNPRGVLAIDKANLVLLFKQNESKSKILLDDLIKSKVADIEIRDDGMIIITNRRMIRENAKSEARSEAGKKGGAKTQQKIKNSFSKTKDFDLAKSEANSGIGNGIGNDNSKGYEGGTGEEKEFGNSTIRQFGNEPEDNGEYYPDFGEPGQGIGLVPVSRCIGDYLGSNYEEVRNALACNYSLPIETINQWATVFARVLHGEGEIEKSMSDFTAHFSRWLNKRPNKTEPQKYFSHDVRNGNANGSNGHHHTTGNKHAGASIAELQNRKRSGGANDDERTEFTPVEVVKPG